MARIVSKKGDKDKKLAEKKAKSQVRGKAIYALEDAKKELMLEFVKNVDKEIAKREVEFVKKLEKYEIANTDENGIVVANKSFDTAEFIDNAFKPMIKIVGTTPKYSADNVYMAFDYFKDCVRKINKYGFYLPTKEDFCGLLGISTSRFNDYKRGNDLALREVCQQVEDYIASQLSQAGMVGKAEKLTGMYYQRVSLNRVEPKEAERPASVTNNFILSDEQFREFAKRITNNGDT